jgi:hypothetical protein
MQTKNQLRPDLIEATPTPEEKLFKQILRQSDGEKARAEYQARQAAMLANMQRLRSLRQAQAGKAAL